MAGISGGPLPPQRQRWRLISLKAKFLLFPCKAHPCLLTIVRAPHLPSPTMWISQTGVETIYVPTEPSPQKKRQQEIHTSAKHRSHLTRYSTSASLPAYCRLLMRYTSIFRQVRCPESEIVSQKLHN